MRKQDDLAVCRSVKYFKSPRKGARKCSQCGFFFVPDEQRYPLREQIIGVESHITGVEWLERFGCCPNCEPANYRRCLGRRVHETWSYQRGCGAWFTFTSRTQEQRKDHRRQLCNTCNPFAKHSEQTRNKLIELGRQFVQEHGRAPTKKETRQFKWNPGDQAIRIQFGSLSAYHMTLMQEPRKGAVNVHRPIKYSDYQILAVLRDAYKTHGHALSRREWKQLGLAPSSDAIRDRFGSWRNAWLAIGAEPNAQGNNSEWMLKISRLSMIARGIDPDAPHTAHGDWQRRREREGKEQDRWTQINQEKAEREQRFRDAQFKKKPDCV